MNIDEVSWISKCYQWIKHEMEKTFKKCSNSFFYKKLTSFYGKISSNILFSGVTGIII